MISYQPLWITLAKKEMKKKDMQELCKVYPSTLSKLTKNQPVSLEIIERICIGLKVPIQEVVEVREDDA